MKQGHFDSHGNKIPSQHSPKFPGKRIAGLPGGTPRWQASVVASWNRYERRDEKRRVKGIGPQLNEDWDRKPHVLTMNDVQLPAA
jgi:hypothetical protein